MGDLNYQNPPTTDAILDSRLVGADASGNERRREKMDAPDAQDSLELIVLELRAIKAVLIAMNPQLDPADFKAASYQEMFTSELTIG